MLPSSAAVYPPRLLGTSRVSASVPSTTPWNLPRVISHCPVFCCDLPPSFKLRRLARWQKQPVLLCLNRLTLLPLPFISRTNSAAFSKQRIRKGLPNLYSPPQFRRALTLSLAWLGHVRALISPDQRVSSLVQQPAHRPSPWLSIGTHSSMLRV